MAFKEQEQTSEHVQKELSSAACFESVLLGYGICWKASAKMLKQETPEAKEDRLMAMIASFVSPKTPNTEEDAMSVTKSSKGTVKAVKQVTKVVKAVKVAAKQEKKAAKPIVTPVPALGSIPSPKAPLRKAATMPAPSADTKPTAKPVKSKAERKVTLTAFIRALVLVCKYTDEHIEKEAVRELNVSGDKAHNWLIGIRAALNRGEYGYVGKPIEKIVDGAAKG